MMAKCKERDKAVCYKCGEPETTIPTVQCQQATSKVSYNSLRKPLKNWLTKMTSLAMMKAVLCHMGAYHQQKHQVVEMNELCLAAVYQATIGPRSFGEGLLTNQWLVHSTETIQPPKGREQDQQTLGFEADTAPMGDFLEHVAQTE